MGALRRSWHTYRQPRDRGNMSVTETFDLMNLGERHNRPELKQKIKGRVGRRSSQETAGEVTNTAVRSQHL